MIKRTITCSLQIKCTIRIKYDSSIRFKCCSACVESLLSNASFSLFFFHKMKSIIIKTKLLFIIIIIVVQVIDAVVIGITQIGTIALLVLRYNAIGGTFRLFLFSFAISRPFFSIRHTIFDHHLRGRTFGAGPNAVQ